MELPVLLCPRRDADAPAESWQELPASPFSETVSGALPQQATRVRTWWAEDALRVLFQVEDTHVWATLTERDGPLWEEEVVEVFLDPCGDLESYFELEVNPLNTVLDLVLRRNRSGYVKDFAWRCDGLRTAVQRTATGWDAELAIPFLSVSTAPPQPGDRWRANFCRIDRPPGGPRELTSWSPAGRANFHTPERFGFLEFAP